MRELKSIILLLIMIIPSLGMGQMNSLLWEISGNGLKTSSYLYGTFHSKDSRAHEFGDSVLTKLGEVETVVVENIDMEDGEQLEALELMMMENTKLADLLNEKDYLFIQEQALDKMGMAGLFYNNMKPVFTTIMAVELNSRQEIPNTVDDFFKEESKRLNKKLIGLETKEEAMSAINSIPLRDQAKMLVDFFRNFDEQILLSDSIIRLYQSQKLDDLYSFYKNQKELPVSFDEELVIERNNKFSDKLVPLINKGSVFCAVGALHLPGKSGLINSLREKGYIVKEVVSQYSNNLTLLDDNNTWYDYSNDSLNLTMSFFDDPYYEVNTMYVSETDSIEMLNYFILDSATQIKYMVSVGKLIDGNIKLDDIIYRLKKNVGWKLVREKSLIYNNIESKEVEFNIAAGLNINYRLSIYDGKLYLCGVAGNKIKIYSNLTDNFYNNISFSEINIGKELELIGTISLIDEITLKGDTVYSKDSEPKINVTIYNPENESVLDGVNVSIGDTIYHNLSFNGFYKIIFHCEGYQEKGFYVDTRNVPLQSETFNYGAEFPYNVHLIKISHNNNEKIKHVISYDNENDYFGIRLID